MISVHDLNRAIGPMAEARVPSHVDTVGFPVCWKYKCSYLFSVSKEAKLCKLRISLGPARQTVAGAGLGCRRGLCGRFGMN